MTTDEAMSLLSNWAQRPLIDEFFDLTAQIAKRLGYLPLALKLAGSQLRIKEPLAWLDAFQAQKLVSRRPEMLHDNLYDTFSLSLNNLTTENRFLYLSLAIFKDNKAIPKEVIHKLWTAAGNIDSQTVEEILQDLAACALLQFDMSNDVIGLHDLLHDYASDELGRDGWLKSHRLLINTYRQTQIGLGWPTVPDDGYIYQYLPFHLVESEYTSELQQLFLDPAWLKIQKNHQPSLKNYMSGLNFALEATLKQGLDGLPFVIAYGLIKGTLTTATYQITQEQIKQMIGLQQVDLILDWANRLPSSVDWFRVDFLQLAGEVAILKGQKERAKTIFQQTAEQLKQIPSIQVTKYLKTLAINFARLNDRKLIIELLDIAGEIPDAPWYSKHQTVKFIQPGLFSSKEFHHN